MRLARVGAAGSYVVAVIALSAVVAAPAWAGSPPTVTEVTPRYGGHGTEVLVSGANFEEVIEVRFGTVGTTAFDAARSVLEVAAPAGPGPAGRETGTVHVTVVTASGVSEATSADVFTYTTVPEYGRCLRFSQEYWINEFKTNSCTTRSEKFAPYSWFPAFGPLRPLQRRHFTIAGGEVKLETVGRTLISCKAETGAGEYTAAQSVAETLTLTGCHESASGCQSEGAAAGEIRSTPLEGLLGRLVKYKLGQELAAASGEVLAEFECAGTPVTVLGAVTGEVQKEDKMTTTVTWKAKEKKGTQGLAGLTGLPGAHPEVKVGAGSFEGAGLGASSSQTSEEEVEID
jgi:hypothetical protein